MAPSAKRPTSSGKSVPPATKKLNTSAAEPSTSAERPQPSKAEQPRSATKPPTAKKPHRGKPELLDSTLAYKGRIFSVFTDTVLLPGDTEARPHDVIRHNGSVVILGLDESKNPQDPDVILIRQFRYAAGQYLLELPAGRIDPGEAPLPAAKREMIEETGFRAKRWTLLTKYFASPGFLGEWMAIYLARDLTPGTARPEEDEFIDLVPTPLSKALELAAANKIHDGKTLIGLLLLHQARQEGRL